jgi:precorrin-6Y C5,15-methyltransferase (decarboxylating)
MSARRSVAAQVTVIGWDGGALSAQARAALDEATLVVGGARHLDALGLRGETADAGTDAGKATERGSRRATLALGPLAPALAALTAHQGPAAVLASGDPGFFGVLRALTEAGIAPQRVLPAASSVATAFSRAGLTWDDALVVSAHGNGDGRDLRRAANVCRAHPKVAALTGPGAGPQQLARELLTGGLELNRVLLVAQRLSGSSTIPVINRPNKPQNVTLSSATSSSKTSSEQTRSAAEDHEAGRSIGERLEWLTLEEAAGRGRFTQPNVVVCLDPARLSADRGSKRWLAGWSGAVGGWALEEQGFAHRDGQITKAEVRALVLARLAPGVGDLVWDIGAGSGSVGIECARFGAAVVAVEQDAPACERVAANAAALGVQVAVVRGRAPGVLADLPRPDAVFVGGGGIDVVRAALEHRPARVVVALAAVERVGQVVRSLEADGRVVGGVLSQSSRMVPLPDGSHRFAALNPVYVVWGSVA